MVTVYQGYRLPLGPSHFRALQDLAGLSHVDVADYLGVSERSARRWGTTHEPPEDACRFVIDQWVGVREAVADLVTERCPGDGPVLLQWSGTDQERAIVRLAVAALESAGREVVVGF